MVRFGPTSIHFKMEDQHGFVFKMSGVLRCVDGSVNSSRRREKRVYFRNRSDLARENSKSSEARVVVMIPVGAVLYTASRLPAARVTTNAHTVVDLYLSSSYYPAGSESGIEAECLNVAVIADMGRLSSIDLVLDCMGSICPIHLYYGKRYSRIVFTIEYEGVIIISIPGSGAGSGAGSGELAPSGGSPS